MNSIRRREEGSVGARRGCSWSRGQSSARMWELVGKDDGDGVEVEKRGELLDYGIWKRPKWRGWREGVREFREKLEEGD